MEQNKKIEKEDQSAFSIKKQIIYIVVFVALIALTFYAIVSQNENCSNRLVNTGIDGDYWQLEVFGATTISQCYAMTGNQDDSSYCGATLNDGSGTFYWYDDYIKGTETVCFYQ